MLPWIDRKDASDRGKWTILCVWLLIFLTTNAILHFAFLAESARSLRLSEFNDEDKHIEVEVRTRPSSRSYFDNYIVKGFYSVDMIKH